MRNRSPIRSLVTKALITALTFGAVAIFIGLWGQFFRPPLSKEAPRYSPETVAAAKRSRVYPIDMEKGPIIWRDVDYSKGPAASWFPREEAPILSELVAQGKFPPVAERVGPEPFVLEGVEGLGNYGGSWIMAVGSAREVGNVMGIRLSAPSLFRWSPLGKPVVPHLAKSYETRDNHREFIIHLRRGMRWSDGHPFTADDILYWWNHEATDPAIWSQPPSIMMFRAKPGRIEKIDDFSVRIAFESPHPLFPQHLASGRANELIDTPAHYLRRYHPTIGDQELIAMTMRALGQPSPHSLYMFLKNWDNPEHPRLWPWIYRAYKSNPPWNFVRNPYYCAVDEKGRQLPYLDRILLNEHSAKMINLAASNGEYTLQYKWMAFDHYELLMAGRERNDYEVYNWSWGHGASLCLQPNLNRLVKAGEPATRMKSELLQKKGFRQALSLAINRQAIIDSEFTGVTKPAQMAPEPGSPYFESTLYHAFTEYDPERANRLLDGLGLTQRDREGYRTLPDGSRLTLFLVASITTRPEKLQAVVEDWGRVGLRVILQALANRLRRIRIESRDFDIVRGGAVNQILPLLDAGFYVPCDSWRTKYAIGYANWCMRGGFYGNDRANTEGAIPIPEDHPLYRALEVYDEAITTPNEAQRIAIFREALTIAVENLWSIDVCTSVPHSIVVKNGFRNVPKQLLSGFTGTGFGGSETFFFDEPTDSPGAIAQIKAEIEQVTPRFTLDGEGPGVATESVGDVLAKVLARLILSVLALIVILTAVRHPFIGRRLLIMVPTLAIVSVVSFTIIQLPPGDFITSYIAQLEQTGEEADLQKVEEIIAMFQLYEPMVKRYLRWVGLTWFTSFEDEDTGLLQGNMGRSMETLGSVNELIGERLLLTFLISLGTILFTWATAIPIGIYSAVRQYSLGDYIATLIGFIGMYIPNFLLALLLMYASSRYFGINVSGLFSAEYAAQPEWSWGKVKDLLQHIWLPMVVIGTGGTASMIRVMRGNLLDELRKPYVTTAFAKGVRPFKLLLKYPVRLALNPFISGIGGIFPQLVSGGAIVAMVLSFPTVGPLMLSALFNEDMYLAGSMLMLLSMLGIVGVLVSDLLLLMVDPRIRLEGGGR